jgi:RNA polymerase sigma factor (sigma-70 family)
MVTDNELWQAFKEGNKEAYGQLFSIYYKPLYQYGSKLSVDPSSLEDAIQELFLELWQSRTRLADAISVKAYLFKALKIKLIKWKSQECKRIGLSGEETYLLEFSYETHLVQEQEDVELKKKLLKTMEYLTKRQQEAIYLKFYNKMSYEEISKVMDISNQATRNLIYKALLILRENFVVITWWMLINDMLM